MSLKGKTLFAAVAAPVLAGLAAGCGSPTSNNDQGVVFLALGYFADATGSTGLSGVNAVLSADIGSSSIQGVPGAVGQQTLAFMGLENRLRNQFIRVTKFDCDYDVPGSAITVPPDAFASSAVIEPNPLIGGPTIDGAGGSGDVGFGTSTSTSSSGSSGSSSTTSSSTTSSSSSTSSSGAGTGAGGGGVGSAVGGAGISGAATGQGGRDFAEFPIVGPDVYAYLNNNRSALPELPFRMEAQCRATGISSAGDVFTTNDVGITVTFFDVH